MGDLNEPLAWGYYSLVPGALETVAARAAGSGTKPGGTKRLDQGGHGVGQQDLALTQRRRALRPELFHPWQEKGWNSR